MHRLIAVDDNVRSCARCDPYEVQDRGVEVVEVDAPKFDEAVVDYPKEF